MESIGKYLRQTREQRGLTIDQIARETNISRQYLTALEEDRHEAFPAEPYVIGFLRNYSDHLGLDTEGLIGRYRTLKIQEQPAPLAELIRKPTPVPYRPILLGIGAVLAVVLLIFIVPPFISFLGNLPQTLASAGGPHQPKTYNLGAQDKSLTQRLYIGDTVTVDVAGTPVSLALTAIGDEVALGEWKFHLGDELFLDLNDDGTQDIRALLKDVTPSNPKRGAEFTLERLGPPAANLAAGTLPVGDELKPGLPAAGSVSGADVEQKPVVILQDVPAKPFTIDVVFRGYALFRYVVDDGTRQESYFRKGDTVRIDASRKLKVWVSNAGAFTGKVNGANDFEVGRPGEVVARSIEWSKDSSGKTILVANPMN